MGLRPAHMDESPPYLSFRAKRGICLFCFFIAKSTLLAPLGMTGPGELSFGMTSAGSFASARWVLGGGRPTKDANAGTKPSSY